MKRIKASDGKTFAHVLGKGTIEIKRQGQSFIISGSDFQIFGTEPTQTRKMVLVVEDGRLIEDDIVLEDDDNLTDEQREEMQKQKEEALANAENQETEADALEDKKDENPDEQKDGEKKPEAE